MLMEISCEEKIKNCPSEEGLGKMAQVLAEEENSFRPMVLKDWQAVVPEQEP